MKPRIKRYKSQYADKYDWWVCYCNNYSRLGTSARDAYLHWQEEKALWEKHTNFGIKLC